METTYIWSILDFSPCNFPWIVPFLVFFNQPLTFNSSHISLQYFWKQTPKTILNFFLSFQKGNNRIFLRKSVKIMKKKLTLYFSKNLKFYRYNRVHNAAHINQKKIMNSRTVTRNNSIEIEFSNALFRKQLIAKQWILFLVREYCSCAIYFLILFSFLFVLNILLLKYFIYIFQSTLCF